MFPHVLLMGCGINMAVYCYAAQKEKWQTGLCLNFSTAGKDLKVHFYRTITREKDTRTHFNSYMVIYFSITIMKRDSECFLMEGNNSILQSGEQTQKGSTTDRKNMIL